MQVSFVLPKKEEVLNSTLSQAAKDAVIKVLDNAKEGGSVNWGRIIRTGLGLLVKAIL